MATRPIPRPLISHTAFMAIVWAGTSVATVALAIRYYVRMKCFRRLLVDDWIVGFAWVLLAATAITWQLVSSDLYAVMEVGAGMRMPPSDFEDRLFDYTRGQLAILVSFYIGLWSVKLSFLVFFYRLGSQVAYYRTAWWCITIFTVCTGLACLGTIQYSCLTRSTLYLMTRCSTDSAVRYQDVTLKLNCAWDVLTDALIMALPISILWNIRISTRRRLALAAVFALVIITMVFSIVRVSVVTSAANNNGTTKQVESSWLYAWHFIESFVSILVACLASFRALFATQERSQMDRQAKAKEYYEREKDSRGMRALKARAKHFQESLLQTLQSTDVKGSGMQLSSISGSQSELRTESPIKEESICVQEIPE